MLHFIRGCKRLFAAGIVFSARATLFDLVPPKIIAFTVDSVLGGKPMRVPAMVERLVERVGGTTFLRGNIWAVALAVVAMALLMAINYQILIFQNGFAPAGRTAFPSASEGARSGAPCAAGSFAPGAETTNVSAEPSSAISSRVTARQFTGDAS